MITIQQPAMVLNAITRPQIAEYQMWNTWKVNSGVSAEDIIRNCVTVARSTPGLKLKNLVIQCHGAPGQIAIGQGFNCSNVDLFANLRGLVEKIWIVACQPALIPSTCVAGNFCFEDGNLFISEMAQAAHCYVVAPTETQINRAMVYPFGVIPSYEGLVLSYDPSGNITWRHRYPSNHQGE